MGLLLRHRQALAVARVAWLHRDGNDRTGVQVYRVLVLVAQVSATVLHLGDAGVAVVRVDPVLVPCLVLALFVQAGAVLLRGVFDALGAGQRLEAVRVALAAVASLQRAYRSVGLQRGGVDAQGATEDQTRLAQARQHPVEDLLVDLRRQALSCARQLLIRARLGRP